MVYTGTDFTLKFDCKFTVFDLNAFRITVMFMKTRKFLLERDFRENLKRLSKMTVKYG